MWNRTWVLRIFLVLAGLAVYGQVIGFGFVPYDDPAYLTENYFVRQGLSLEGMRWAFVYGSGLSDLKYQGVENLWHPLTWISHMVDVELFGLEGPGGHHAMSLGLYLVSAVLVMWVAGMILGNQWAGFLVALLWMIHPLKVESVAWASERKDILSGLFFWASLGCAMKGFKTAQYWKWGAYGLFLAALLSKPSVVVLPVLIVLVEGFLNQEKNWDFSFLIKGLKQWWVWFVTAGIFAGITVMMQEGGSHEVFVEQSSIISRLLVAGAGLLFYLWRIIAPVGLTFEYGPPAWSTGVLALIWFALIGAACALWLKRAQWRMVFFGVAWFLVCWLPVSGLVYVGSSFTADRYVYLGLAGLLVILVRGLEVAPWGKVLGIAVATVWSLLAWKQVGVWKDGWTLFEHATEARPEQHVGWVNLGGMHGQAGQIPQAVECYEKAIELNPLGYLTWFNLGTIRRDSGDLEKAAEAYECALEIYPDYRPALLNLGLLKRAEGEFEQARDLFRQGLDQDVRMLWLTCECELRLGNRKEAEAFLERLEQANVQHAKIRADMMRMREFLKQQ